MITKKLGRPATGKGQLIGVRIQPEGLDLIDQWIVAQETPLTRPEAIRTIVFRYLFDHLGDFENTASELVLQNLRRPEDPQGPATEVVKSMDAAIAKDRAHSRKPRSKRSRDADPENAN